MTGKSTRKVSRRSKRKISRKRTRKMRGGKVVDAVVNERIDGVEDHKLGRFFNEICSDQKIKTQEDFIQKLEDILRIFGEKRLYESGLFASNGRWVKIQTPTALKDMGIKGQKSYMSHVCNILNAYLDKKGWSKIRGQLYPNTMPEIKRTGNVLTRQQKLAELHIKVKENWPDVRADIINHKSPWIRATNKGRVIYAREDRKQFTLESPMEGVQNSVDQNDKDFNKVYNSLIEQRRAVGGGKALPDLGGGRKRRKSKRVKQVKIGGRWTKKINLGRVTRKAKAIFKKKNNVSGEVLFEEVKNGVKVTYDFKGLKNGKHGFHVHQKGDFKGDCNNAGPHFNPHGHNHSGRKSNERHVGDLGNVITNNKKTKGSFIDKKILLKGKNNIIGRSVIVHDLKDDLGKGKNKESLKTGNAGARLNCAKILKSK